MFLVLGTDYVDVTFSADGLFGMLAKGVFVFLLLLDVEGREGIGGTRDRFGVGWDFGLMGEVERDGFMYLAPITHLLD